MPSVLLLLLVEDEDIEADVDLRKDQTNHSRQRRVIVQSHHASYIWIFNAASIHRLVSFADARDWGISSASGSEGFHIEGCRLLAGLRSTLTLVEEDGLWSEGSDGSQLFVSVRLGREWIRREFARVS